MEENIILIYGLKKCINNIRVNFEPSLNIFFFHWQRSLEKEDFGLGLLRRKIREK